MKIRITILFVLATWFVANAQQKNSKQFQSVFGSESTKWYFVGNLIDGLCTDSLLYIGETTVDEVVFKAFGYNSISQPDVYYIEKENNSKLYSKFRQNEEILIMDLSLEVGDDFVVPLIDVSVVVDSVYYIDERKHIRFNYIPYVGNGYMDSLMFIEGIGPSYLPIMDGSLFYVRCKYNNDTLQYCGRIANNCQCVYEIRSSIAKAHGLQNKYLVSNLTDNYIEFKNITNKAVITIYTVQGSVVLQQTDIYNGSKVNISYFKNGIYIVGIKNENAEIFERIVKTP